MKQIWKKLGGVFLALCMVLAMLPTVAFASDTSVSITGKTVSESIYAIQDAIEAASSGDTVTVTGTMTNAAAQLPISISEGVTVVWKASITGEASYGNGLIIVSGDGTFEVADGGTVKFILGVAISNGGHVKVSGGTVSTTSGLAISSGDIEISGGIVEATGTDGVAIQAYGATVTVSGGTVQTSGKDGIAIASRIGNTSIATITICGDGVVKATGLANYGTAIYSGKGTLEVKDNAQVTAVSGYAIDATNDVTISGGTVSSGLNTAIHQEGSGDITVSGGTVSNAATGSASPVIYMDSDFPKNIVVSGTGKVLAQGSGGYRYCHPD